MVEKWKKIADCSNYEVSSNGNIRNITTGHILKPYLGGAGYLYVRINKKKRLVHRLVAQAFIPNPNNYPQINHKDEIKTNNDMENLEWCTQSYNNNYGTRRDKISEANKKRVVSDQTRQKMSITHKNISDETRMKMSKAHKGKVHNSDWNNAVARSKMKRVLQFDLNDNMIAEFDSLKEASEITKVCVSSISSNIHGKRKTAGGYIWKMPDDDKRGCSFV